jgi:RNA polymerase sigma factor (sigma-70 family)
MNPERMSGQPSVSDEELIVSILGGEKNLYAALVRRYNQRLYRVGMAILNDDPDVEDAMQTTYVNAYTNLKSFGFKASFSTWLTRILINECFLRLKKRTKTAIMNDGYIETQIQQRQMDNPTTPYTNTANSELRTILDNAIRQLPEMYRTVFVLREIENLNVSETQECLSISESNVKVRLNRAKAMLRQLLGAYYNKEDILHFHLSRCDRMVERVMKQIESLPMSPSSELLPESD